MIQIIAAHSKNRVIGRNGDIPWSFREDLELFKQETMGAALVMGRRTFESLPGVLPGRPHFVVTSRPLETESDMVTQAASIEEAIAAAKDHEYSDIFAAGGARIYEEMIPLAERMILTEVDITVDDGDTWFPDYDPMSWDIYTEYILAGKVHTGTVRAMTRRK